MQRLARRVVLWGACVAGLVTILVAVQFAFSYSANDSSFYDGLTDISAFEPSMTVGVALDPLNGLRLSTTGTQSVNTWTTADDFNGLNSASAGPLVGRLTLEPGVDGVLRLPATPLALSPDSTRAVVAPSFDGAADRGDAYEVHGPSVLKLASNDYRMWYSGVSPDGYVQRIFEATSTNGTTWNRVQGPLTGGSVVDVGPSGSFDSHGLVRPSVVYDASSTAAPFKMYYGTIGDASGAIGSATSTDGVHWSKFEATTGTPSPVLVPGLTGQADGYSVGEPSVIYDPTNKIFHMWYAASPSPDVTGRQVGYASSANTTSNAFGGVWGKGGIVNLSTTTGNWGGGWFSPGVWFEGGATPFGMMFSGTKGGGQPYKIIGTNLSSNATYWVPSNVLLNNAGAWAGNNMYWASVLRQGANNYVVYYTGNGGSGDAARNAIGYATWDGSGGLTDQSAAGPLLAASVASATFDSNFTANGGAVRTVDASGNPTWAMVYGGRGARDLTWRLGAATSGDLHSWSKLAGKGDASRKTIFSLGGAGSFDASGAAMPSVFSLDASGTTLGVMYQAQSSAGAHTFGIATETAGSLDTWSRYGSAVLSPGAAWDSADIAHPSVVKVNGGYRCYYAGSNGTTWSIGYATSSNLTSWTKQTVVLSVSATSVIEAGGISDPVVSYQASSTTPYRMWYTAKDVGGTKRISSAVSTDGITWTREGLVLDPSEGAYAFDEMGVSAGGVAYNPADSSWHLFFTGFDRGNAGVSAGLPYTTQWQRIGSASGTGAGYLSAGSAVYECDPVGTPAPGYKYEFLGFDWTDPVPTGTHATYEISYYPAYIKPSGQAADVWSNYSPIELGDTPFLPLTTEKVRWRVSFTRDSNVPAATPQLGAFSVRWRPVAFEATGTATSIPVHAASGRYVDSWKKLKVTASNASTTSPIWAEVLTDDGQVLATSTPLSNGANEVSLSSLPIGTQSVRVRFRFSGNGQSTAYVTNWGLEYTTTNRAPVTDFKASGTTTCTVLSWTEPDYEGFQRTRIVRTTSGFTLNAADASATIVYDETATPNATLSAVDTTASTQGQVYYYTAFTSDGTTWSPPAFAIAVPCASVAGLSGSPTSYAVHLAWTHGTTSTSPSSAWVGTRVLRRTGAAVAGPTDASATVVAETAGTSLDDVTAAQWQTHSYAAYEHYSVSAFGRTYSTYSGGSSASVANVPPPVRTSLGRPSVSPSTPRRYKYATYTVFVTPGAAAGSASTRLYLQRYERRKWRTKSTVTLKVVATGKYQIKVKLRYTGKWRCYATLAASARYYGSKSTYRYFSVK